MLVPPMLFPSTGLPEEEVLRLVEEKLEKNLPPEKNWTTYGPEAHPFAKKVFANSRAIDTYSVEFYRDIYPGIHEMAQASVRMIGALLNASDPAGYITTGGTEANLMAIRLARNLAGIDEPEFIVPVSRHYTFDLAAELFNVKLRLVDVNEDYSPRVDQVEDLINERTVALVCSAPEAHLGGIDPVAEFARIAQAHNIYLHVDAAVGGFILPFMRMLGFTVPDFDFTVDGVMSMTADPHKLGLCPRPSGALIVRDAELLERAIPIDKVVIDTLTASGRPGSSTAAVWALMKHLGAEGYCDLVRMQLETTKLLAEGVETIEGLRLLRQPACNIVCFTSEDDRDLGGVSRGLWKRGYAIPLNTLFPYPTQYMRLYVHPLKTKEAAERLLTDLEGVVSEVS